MAPDENGTSTSSGDGPLHLAEGVKSTAPYSSRPPSPPFIHIPAVAGSGDMTIVPSYRTADPTLLTEEDLRIITQNLRPQMASDTTMSWRYDMRRDAQPILDFLYLGPWSAAKDPGFLRRERVTMLLAVRDSRIAEIRAMSVERTARELGIVADHVDVAGNQELIRVFPDVTRKINDHMLQVYRSQAVPVVVPTASAGAAEPSGGTGTGTGTGTDTSTSSMAIDKAKFRRGKVLVFCESGNTRSAALVAAYIMSVFSVDLVTAIQFVSRQRFCANFDDETKTWLRAYQDILDARRAVADHRRQLAAYSLSPPLPSGPGTGAAVAPQYSSSSKRSIEQTFDAAGDDEMEEDGYGQDGNAMAAACSSIHDMERYIDRPFFVPFIDSRDSEMAMGD